MRGSVYLSHELPGPFAVVSPLPDAVVATREATLAWTPSSRAARYILEIEQHELGFRLEVALPPLETSFTIPSGLLRTGERYEYSLTVEGDTDNELEIEGTFRVAALWPTR